MLALIRLPVGEVGSGQVAISFGSGTSGRGSAAISQTMLGPSPSGVSIHPSGSPPDSQPATNKTAIAIQVENLVVSSISILKLQPKASPQESNSRHALAILIVKGATGEEVPSLKASSHSNPRVERMFKQDRGVQL